MWLPRGAWSPVPPDPPHLSQFKPSGLAPESEALAATDPAQVGLPPELEPTAGGARRGTPCVLRCEPRTWRSSPPPVGVPLRYPGFGVLAVVVSPSPAPGLAAARDEWDPTSIQPPFFGVWAALLMNFEGLCGMGDALRG